MIRLASLSYFREFTNIGGEIVEFKIYSLLSIIKKSIKTK